MAVPFDREATGNLNQQSPFHDKKIKAALSTQIIVKVLGYDGRFYPVGAIQSLTPTETRGLARISEIGTDGVIQIVPNTAPTFELAVTRMVFDYQRLPAAFQRGFRHIHSARLPFDIEITDYNPYRELSFGAAEGDISNAVVTRYVNCWLQNYTYTYSMDNYLITENASIWAETVFDNVTPSPAVSGYDAIEKKNNESPVANTLSEAYVIPPTAGGNPSGSNSMLR
jgi:hypothetical protein